MDMDISMDIHAKSVDMDMDMDGKFHIHGNPGKMVAEPDWCEVYASDICDVLVGDEACMLLCC